MSVQLLDKTRKINLLLHNNRSSKVVFDDICDVLTDCLDSNVLVLSRKGKILGSGKTSSIDVLEQLRDCTVGTFVDKKLNDRFLGILSTKENVNLETLGFTGEQNRIYTAIVNPIEIAGERLGTVFLYRKAEEDYTIDDIIVSEYGTTVVSLEMLRSVNEEELEEQRKRQVVRSAIGTLSGTEHDAVELIIRELEGREGVLVASKVADRAGITRSVIVNALRKLESAGVIESRSSGMKGTYIRVVNEYLLEELG